MDRLQNAKQICIFYEKYSLTIRVGKTDYFLIWGADSTDGGDDKLLIDQGRNILLFRRPTEALIYILDSLTPLFDKDKLKEWAAASQATGTYSNCLFDLGELVQLVENDRLMINKKARRTDVLYWINFINLVGDYAHQIDDRYLLALRKSESINSFWEYGYDTFFWTIPEPELLNRQTLILAAFQYDHLKVALLNLLDYFKSRFVVYLPA